MPSAEIPQHTLSRDPQMADRVAPDHFDVVVPCFNLFSGVFFP